MKSQVAKRLAAALVSILVLVAAQVSFAHAQPAPSAWPMLGQNPQRTGKSLFDGPLTNNIRWVTSPPCQSLVIGTEAIYVSATSLCAVNFDGQLNPAVDEWLADIPPETGSSWVFSLPDGLPEGTYTIFAQAVDLDGTMSNAVSSAVVVQAAAP